MSVCIVVVIVVDNMVFEVLCQDVMVQLDVVGIVSLFVIEVNVGFNDVCSIVEVEIG